MSYRNFPWMLLMKQMWKVFLLLCLPALAHAQSWEGVMLGASENKGVFYIQDGKRRYIPDPKIVMCLGDWGQVVDMDWPTVQTFPDGGTKFDCGKAPNADALFNYNFKMNDPGSNHIHASIRADQFGEIGGWFTYDNDSMWGFCGGIVV